MSNETIGYHEIRRGMVFEEVTPKKTRRVTVVKAGIYDVHAQWTSARGCIRNIRIWNKHLTDPSRWQLVDRGETP